MNKAILNNRSKSEQDKNVIILSEADTLLIMDLLDNPPQPNEKLMQAAKSFPKSRK